MLKAPKPDARPALLLPIGGATYLPLVSYSKQKPAALRISKIRLIAER